MEALVALAFKSIGSETRKRHYPQFQVTCSLKETEKAQVINDLRKVGFVPRGHKRGYSLLLGSEV